MPASRSHPDYTPVKEALRRLKAAHDADGNRLEVIELPQPKKVQLGWSGQPLATSYVNFYLPNGAVVMPAFGDANDEVARSVLADVFIGRDIMQIDAVDIVQGGGGIHCITQQEPQA
jgi:agmatine deiminase